VRHSEKGYSHEGEEMKRAKSSVCLLKCFLEMIEHRRKYEREG
jgi:hypothetical protein